MKKLIKPSLVKGSLIAPSSKSVAQRAIIASLLANGKSELLNMTLCDDTKAAIEVIKAFGSEVNENKNNFTISSKGIKSLGLTDKSIFCGESGLLARMITPVVALMSNKVVINGHGSILTRPFSMIEEPLHSLGVNIFTNNGFLPISIQGPMTGGVVEIDGSISSQFLTGLLMALPLARNNSTIIVKNLKSKPYIDITLDLLKSFGIEILNENYEIFHIRENQFYIPTKYDIEGDWSGASCLLVAGAIAGEVSISNLDIYSTQADKAIIDVLKLANANIYIKDNFSGRNTITTFLSDNLKAFEFDASECPDLFPSLVALASNCNGVSSISGAKRLKYKESDRATILKNEFGKLGIEITVDEDKMFIRGGKISKGEVSSHNDHRIAMSLATAALRSEEEIIINDSESVSKSYLDFWNDLEKITSNI